MRMLRWTTALLILFAALFGPVLAQGASDLELLRPSDGANVGSLLVFSWKQVSDANTYDLEINEFATLSDINRKSSFCAAETCNISLVEFERQTGQNFQDEYTYAWRVVAYGTDSTEIASSLAFTFTYHTSPESLPREIEGGLVPCGGDGQPACNLCHLFELINNIYTWALFALIPIIAPIFIVIGGIYLLVARGNPETFTKGKNVLTAAVVGLIIVYVAWVAVNTVLNTVGVAEWTGLGTWWDIQCTTE